MMIIATMQAGVFILPQTPYLFSYLCVRKGVYSAASIMIVTSAYCFSVLQIVELQSSFIVIRTTAQLARGTYINYQFLSQHLATVQLYHKKLMKRTTCIVHEAFAKAQELQLRLLQDCRQSTQEQRCSTQRQQNADTINYTSSMLPRFGTILFTLCPYCGQSVAFWCGEFQPQQSSSATTIYKCCTMHDQTPLTHLTFQ